MEQQRRGAWRIAAVIAAIFIAIIAGLFLIPSDSLKNVAPVDKVREAVSGKEWKDLTESEKDCLEPLEEKWKDLDAAKRSKWLRIAKKMAKMEPEARERIKSHIEVWLKLTPEQQQAARENFKGIQSLDAAAARAEKWIEYQQLPEEKKKELAERARKRRLARSQPKVEPPKVEEPPAPPPPPPPPKPKNTEEEVPEYWR